MLEEAEKTCAQGILPKVSAKSSGVHNVVQHTRQSRPSYAATLRNFCVKDIPVFHIFEATCWIYTSCIDPEEIQTEREAEFYLYQLLLIFDALKETKWISGELIPSTIAAAGSRPSNDPPLNIALLVHELDQTLFERR